MHKGLGCDLQKLLCIYIICIYEYKSVKSIEENCDGNSVVPQIVLSEQLTNSNYNITEFNISFESRVPKKETLAKPLRNEKQSVDFSARHLAWGKRSSMIFLKQLPCLASVSDVLVLLLQKLTVRNRMKSKQVNLQIMGSIQKCICWDLISIFRSIP